MRKLVERIILFVLGSLSAITALFLSYHPEEPVETLNRWFKISTDEATPEVITLDMSRGYSYTDYGYILLVVQDSDNKDQIVIAFPDGGYWEAPMLNPELNKSIPWKKKY